MRELRLSKGLQLVQGPEAYKSRQDTRPGSVALKVKSSRAGPQSVGCVHGGEQTAWEGLHWEEPQVPCGFILEGVRDACQSRGQGTSVTRNGGLELAVVGHGGNSRSKGRREGDSPAQTGKVGVEC